MVRNLLEEDFGGDVGVATSQIPRVADETLLFVGQRRGLNAGHVGVERSVASHDGVHVIEGLLPGGFGGTVHRHFLFGSLQEQTRRFL